MINVLGGVEVDLLGLVLILTTVINFCPLYMPFKINTCKHKK